MKTEIDRASILGPDRWQGKPELAADIMIKILSANYGNHNITNNQGKLINDIREGTLLPWISKDETSCAALIKQNDTDVEIGRAACIPRHEGGKSGPILSAVARWQEAEVFPESKILRAEIRTAKPTKEVPGGQATQAIFIRNLEFGPTALGPFFHHGLPDRQEMFMLANITKERKKIIDMSKKITIPEVAIVDEAEREMLDIFWRLNFGNQPRLVSTKIGDTCSFLVKDVGPFVVLTPDQEAATNWQSTISNHFNAGHRFALAKLNLTTIDPPELSRGIIDLRRD